MSGGELTAVPLDAAELRNRLAALPRFHLTELPTPHWTICPTCAPSWAARAFW